MVRGLTAVSLSIALQAGALCAPLLHVHLDDHDEAHHHGGRRVHAHFSGHAHGERHGVAGMAAIGAAGDQAQIGRLQHFLAVHPKSFSQSATPAAVFAMAPPVESAMQRPPDVVRSHGPPHIGRSQTRAPPAPPSRS